MRAGAGTTPPRRATAASPPSRRGWVVASKQRQVALGHSGMLDRRSPTQLDGLRRGSSQRTSSIDQDLPPPK